jgi:hypothetical protein
MRAGALLVAAALILAGCMKKTTVVAACPKTAPEVHEPETIKVPAASFQKDSLKVRLMGLLLESMRDEGRGIVDLRREREIQKIMGELKTK